MKRATALLCTAAIVLWTAGTLAQARPDFSGKWTLVPAEGAAAPAGGGGRGGRGGRGGFGMEFTIAQTPTTLTVTTVQGETTSTRTYTIGGESKNMMMGRGGQQMEQVSKTAWDGDRLVITTTTQAGESRMVLSIQAGNLTIETTGPGRDGGPGTPVTQTYRKS
jgi:hypothetical protein